VGPRAGLDAGTKRKILCPCRGSNPDRPARSQTLYRLSYRGSVYMFSPINKYFLGIYYERSDTPSNRSYKRLLSSFKSPYIGLSNVQCDSPLYSSYELLYYELYDCLRSTSYIGLYYDKHGNPYNNSYIGLYCDLNDTLLHSSCILLYYDQYDSPLNSSYVGLDYDQNDIPVNSSI
jgi:hypothetical protein